MKKLSIIGKLENQGKMYHKLYTILTKPYLLLFSWMVFFLSPLLGPIRLYFLQNPNQLNLGIPGVLSAMYYFPFLISMVVLVVQLVWIREFILGRLDSKHKVVFILISIMSVISIFIFQSLINLQFVNYPNYIYSNYGITLIQLQFYNFVSTLQIILFFTFLFIYYSSSKIKNSSLNVSKFEMLGYIIPIGGKITLQKISNIVSLVALASLFTMSVSIFFDANKLIKSSQEGYEGKVGKDYKYLDLLSRFTSRDSNIIHPPQGDFWPAIGNQPLIRYFLFPRVLVSGALILDDKIGLEIQDAYFIEIIGNNDRPNWPIIISDKKEIIFDNENIVKFEKLEIKYKSEDGVVYRILF